MYHVFTPVLWNWNERKFPQVSRIPSEYSSRTCRSRFFLRFPILPVFFFQEFGDHSKYTTYNWYHYSFHGPKLLYFYDNVNAFVYFFPFCLFSLFTWLFLLINSRSVLQTGITWSIFYFKIPKNSLRLISLKDFGLCIYHLVVWSNFNHLHGSQWITFPSQSCPVLYCFCVKLLHSLIWLNCFMSIST